MKGEIWNHRNKTFNYLCIVADNSFDIDLTVNLSFCLGGKGRGIKDWWLRCWYSNTIFSIDSWARKYSIKESMLFKPADQSQHPPSCVLPSIWSNLLDCDLFSPWQPPPAFHPLLSCLALDPHILHPCWWSLDHRKWGPEIWWAGPGLKWSYSIKYNTLFRNN